MKSTERSVHIEQQYEQYLAGPHVGNVFGTTYLEYFIPNWT